MRVLRLDKANVIFAAYFKLRGYTNLFPVVIVSIRHDLPSDMSSIFYDLFWNIKLFIAAR